MGRSHDLAQDQFHTVLIAEILRGDVDAFGALIERYRDLVAQIALRHVRREHAADVAQETFIRAFRSLRHFKGIHPFRNWLSRIALRTCYDFWRQHYRRQETPFSSLSPAAQTWVEGVLRTGEGPERAAEHAESVELLHWALGQLAPEDRLVLTPAYFEELSHQEVAAPLEWTVANVTVRSFRARQHLREILGRAVSREETA